MAADGLSEIDLYDNIDEDFVQECTDLTELYDDVIAPTTESTTNNSNLLKTTSNSIPYCGRRVALYVGNLTWWTTDLDLLEAANKVAINDVLEIKFHENRQNGQSKGFCVVVLGSDQSMRLALEKLPKIEIHGQNPVVTTCTKHNLGLFEKAAGGDSQTASRQRSEETQNVNNSIGAGISKTSHTGNNLGNRPPAPLIANPNLPASLGFSLRNNAPLMGQAIPNVRSTSTVTPNLQQNQVSQNLQPNLHSNQMNHLPMSFSTPTNILLPSTAIPSPALIANAPGLLSSAFPLPNQMPTTLAGTNAHVNPNFLSRPVPATANPLSNNIHPPPGLVQLNNQNPDTTIRPLFDQYGRPVVNPFATSVGKLSDSEFDDILQRNKTVSSSAINRAVQDAAGGDYASAIETLVTAISLIKQSKIANDDRCRILINSLQDTLHGIESKSYGSKSRRRRRSYSDSGSEGDGPYSASGSGSTSSRRHRDRGHRSRSRDRHDRHRHSHDRGSGSSYYNNSSGAQHSSTTLSGTQSSDVGISGSANLISGSDRYRESRYRH